MGLSPPSRGISLCAGAGGLDMGLMLGEPGYRTECFVEIEPDAQEAIIAAQRVGSLHQAPVWDNVFTFVGDEWRGRVDTIIAGYPCQPFSQAGERKGETDERHLWPDVARIIQEVREPSRDFWVFLENVAGHLSLGLETVLRDLWSMGFTPSVFLGTAEEVGASQIRERVFILAFARGHGCGEREVVQRERGPDHNKCGEDPDGCLDDLACGMRSKRTAGRRKGFEGSEGGDEPSRRSEEDLAGPRDGQLPQPGRGSEGRDGSGSAGEEPMGRASEQSSELRRATGIVQSARGGSEEEGIPGAGCEPQPAVKHLPISPPGPTDAAGWRAVLRMAPDLAPAVSLGDIARQAAAYSALVETGQLAETEAESALCRMADALAGRTRALRLLGNGVVPLAAAYAYRSLAASLGLRPVDLEAVLAEEFGIGSTDPSLMKEQR